MSVPENIKFGWKKDVLSEWDKRKFAMAMLAARVYHPDLEKIHRFEFSLVDVPVFQQGNLGSCTANALLVGFMIQFARQRNESVATEMSRLFLYYEERVMERTTDRDEGAQLYTGINVLKQVGVCLESLDPYDISNFRNKPAQNAYDDALTRMVVDAAPVPQNVRDIKQNILEEHPVSFGFMVFPSFMTIEVARSGVAPMPGPQEQPVGGHAVTITGWDDNIHGGCFIVRNSWGSDWGIKGNFYMPYAYATNPSLASDFWAIKRVHT